MIWPARAQAVSICLLYIFFFDFRYSFNLSINIEHQKMHTIFFFHPILRFQAGLPCGNLSWQGNQPQYWKQGALPFSQDSNYRLRRAFDGNHGIWSEHPDVLSHVCFPQIPNFSWWNHVKSPGVRLPHHAGHPHQMSMKKAAITARALPSFLRFGSAQLAAKRG